VGCPRGEQRLPSSSTTTSSRSLGAINRGGSIQLFSLDACNSFLPSLYLWSIYGHIYSIVRTCLVNYAKHTASRTTFISVDACDTVLIDTRTCAAFLVILPPRIARHLLPGMAASRHSRTCEVTRSALRG